MVAACLHLAHDVEVIAKIEGVFHIFVLIPEISDILILGILDILLRNKSVRRRNAVLPLDVRLPATAR